MRRVSDVTTMCDCRTQNTEMDDVITEVYLADISCTNGVRHSNDVAFVNWSTEATLGTCVTVGGKTLPVDKTVCEQIAVFIRLTSGPINPTDFTTEPLKFPKRCSWNAAEKTLRFFIECSGKYELTAFRLSHDRSSRVSIFPRFITGRHPELDLTRSFYEFQPYYPLPPDPAVQWFDYVISGLPSKFLLTFKSELECVITPADGSILVTCLENGKSCDVTYGESSQEVTLVTYDAHSYTICVNGTELRGKPKPIVPRDLEKFDPTVCQVDPTRKLELCSLEQDGVLSVEQCDNIRRILKNDANIDLVILHRLVKLVLTGKHYRNQATLHEKLRIFYKTQATEEYKAKKHTLAGICSQLKTWHAERMALSHRQAMESYRTFYNWDREENQIDLHELRAYDDSTTKQTGEAIEVLEEVIEKCKQKSLWLEVIVGSGHHSKKRQQTIRPVVEQYLEKHNLKFKPCNKGALVVDFKPFDGKQPFFGHFYCEGCDKLWESRCCWFDETSSEHKFYGQRCYRCKAECFPLKPGELCKPDHRRESNGKSQTKELQEYHRSHCLKCQAIERRCFTLK